MFKDMDWQAIKVTAMSQPHQAGLQSAAIIEAIHRSVVAQSALQTATEAASDCAAAQTAVVIRLTRALHTLTWVLVGVGFVQIALMLWKG